MGAGNSQTLCEAPQPSWPVNRRRKGVGSIYRESRADDGTGEVRTSLRGGAKDCAPLGSGAHPDDMEIPGQSREDVVAPPPARVPLFRDQGNDANIRH